MQTDATIRGLRIAVSYEISPPEPDVGLFYPWVSVGEIWVYGKNGKAKPADWLARSMSEDEWSELEEYLRYA